MSSVVDRFIRYVKIDTQSDLDSESFPSTAKQLDLARLLVQELKALGLKDVTLDEHGYVMAKLPSNLDRPYPLRGTLRSASPNPLRVPEGAGGDQDTRRGAPAIGFMAHMDTSPDMSGANVRPRFVEHYDGGDI